MERHAESFGDTLHTFQRDIFLATGNSIQILLADTHASGQLCLTHVFFDMAFFRSIFVVLFIDV